MKTKAAPPLHVAWEITRRCNAHCLHCSSDSGPEVPPTAETTAGEAMKIIDQLAEVGVRVLAFSGGEPLLRPDLSDLIRRAAEKGLQTNLCTNGSLIDREAARQLRQSGLGSATVSLDGAYAATHDQFRRFPGLFHMSLNAIRTLNDQGVRANVSFTPTTLNYQEVESAADLAYALGAELFCVSQYVPTGRGTRELMLSPQVLGTLAQETVKLRAKYARRMNVLCHDCHAVLLLTPEEQEGCKGCGAGCATAGIQANGLITPCIFMPNAAGSLRKNSFGEIWETSPELSRLRDREQLKTGNCSSCRFKLVCGGCRAAAMAIHGNPLAGDPSCWMFPEPASIAENHRSC